MKIEATMQELSKKLEPKLCKDCRFYKIGFFDRLFCMERFGKCTHSTAIRNIEGSSYRLVDGKGEEYEYRFCATQRDWDCGTEGKFWEAKKK